MPISRQHCVLLDRHRLGVGRPDSAQQQEHEGGGKKKRMKKMRIFAGRSVIVAQHDLRLASFQNG